MNSNRRNLVVLGALATSGLMAGCQSTFTGDLYKNKSHRYVESVSTILITADEKQIVVMTPKYHYIFDAPREVVATMKSGFHKHVSAEFGEMQISSSGASELSFQLFVRAGASTAEQEQAMALGYTKRENRAGILLGFDGRMRGTRYDANGVQPKQGSMALNRTYKVTVRSELSNEEKAARVLMTPVTVAADGVMLLGAIALAPFAIVGALGFLVLVSTW